MVILKHTVNGGRSHGLMASLGQALGVATYAQTLIRGIVAWHTSGGCSPPPGRYQEDEEENDEDKNITFLIQVANEDLSTIDMIILKQGFKLLSERLNDYNSISNLDQQNRVS